LFEPAVRPLRLWIEPDGTQEGKYFCRERLWLEQERRAAVCIEWQSFCRSSRKRRAVMNSIIWLVGAVVIVLAIMSFFGFR